MKIATASILLTFTILCSCAQNKGKAQSTDISIDSVEIKTIEPQPEPVRVVIEKEFLYDQHTLEDIYPYKDTTRRFQWDKIQQQLEFLEEFQKDTATRWAVIRNKSNSNGESPVVREYHRNDYNHVTDPYGVERYQSAAFYLPSDTATAERYGQDGSLLKFKGSEGNYYRVENSNFPGEWLVRRKYVKLIDDSVKVFHKVIFVDRNNQNITTLEKVGSKWLVRSMNPATTGARRPPFQYETPLGIFVIQEKRPRMVYLKDGTTETGGFSPYASRFSSGAFVHGIPINLPHTQVVEISSTLGTVPRSHMCVRTATSHAKFIYDWAPVERSLVVVIE